MAPVGRKTPEQHATTVLKMVFELHRKGYQRIRIMPGVSPSGCYWRCFITPASNILRAHGAWAQREEDWAGASYTTGMMGRYFDWADAEAASPKRLARLFIQRFPWVAESGWGADWAYAGWYMEMLRWVAKGHYPCSYTDGGAHAVDSLPLWGAKPSPQPLPMPPPGEADAPYPWDSQEARDSVPPLGLGPVIAAARAGKGYLGSPDDVRKLVRRFQDDILYRQDEVDFIHAQVTRMVRIFLGEDPAHLPLAGNWNTADGGLPAVIRSETGIREHGVRAVEAFFHLLAEQSICLCDEMRTIEAIADEAVRILLGLPKEEGASDGILSVIEPSPR